MSNLTRERSKRQKLRGDDRAERRSFWPPLDNGYHVSRAEFERRYEMMPDLKKAELIEGVVFMDSPVRNPHGQATGAITAWLGTYRSETPGVSFAENVTVILDANNEVQPDAVLRIEPQCGGQTQLNENEYIEGAPELIVEVAMSSVAYDLHDKFRIYRRNRVLEYVVWQLEEQRVDWFVWSAGEYASLNQSSSGVYCSRVFPGLWLDSAALLSGDLKKVLRELRKGIRSPGHKQFVRALK